MEPDIANTSSLVEAQPPWFDWKWLLFGLLLLITVAVAFFWLGKQSVQTSTVTITPTILAPSPSLSPTVVLAAPTMINYPTKSANPEFCQTEADCDPIAHCSPKLIEMYGNYSHCPLPRCSAGACLYLPVP